MNLLRSVFHDGVPALLNLIVSYLVPKAVVRRLLRVLSAYGQLKPNTNEDEWDVANLRGDILGKEWDVNNATALNSPKKRIRAV